MREDKLDGSRTKNRDAWACSRCTWRPSGRVGELAFQPSFDVSFVVPRPTTGSTPSLLDTHDRSIARAREILGSLDDAALELPGA